MTLLRILIALTILAIIAPKTSAKEFVVGGQSGWKLNVNYSAWAQDKEFFVGDKLIFNYPIGVHNVIKVDGVGFKQCVAADNALPLTTGEDVITLATPGRKWYICGIGQHCAVGQMKVLVTVWPQVESPAPAPEPNSSASGINISKFYSLMLGILGLVVMVMA